MSKKRSYHRSRFVFTVYRIHAVSCYSEIKVFNDLSRSSEKRFANQTREKKLMAKLELDLRVSPKDIPTGSVELVFVKWWRNVRQKHRQYRITGQEKLQGTPFHLGEIKNNQRIIFVIIYFMYLRNPFAQTWISMDRIIRIIIEREN